MFFVTFFFSFFFFEGRGKYYRGLSLSPLIPLSQLSREQRERERERVKNPGRRAREKKKGTSKIDMGK